MWQRFILASLCLLLGCGIVGVSLVNASEVFPNSHNTDAKITRLDITQPILPGHPLYPFTVVSDKCSLLVATQEQKPHRQLGIARERLQDSLQLIDLGQTELAAQTLVKGQKYLVNVLTETPQSYQVLSTEIRTLLQEYQQAINTHKDKFSDPQKVLLDQLSAENETLLLQNF